MGFYGGEKEGRWVQKKADLKNCINVDILYLFLLSELTLHTILTKFKCIKFVGITVIM